jgi:hypothetical protein
MSQHDVGVFVGSDTIQYHLSQFKNSSPLKDCTIFDNSADFLNSKNSIKIAVLHVPYPFDDQFELTVQQYSQHGHVFVMATEVHPQIVRFIHRNDNPNITYYICGSLNFTLEHSPVYPYMDWFETSTYFYKKWLPELLTRLKPYESKYRAFDILLGRKKQHRDFIYERAVKDTPISILTYFNDTDTNFSTDPNKWQWELEGVRMDKQPEWTVDRVQYYGHPMSISQIIPVNIYNQTAYSVIAETCWQNDFAFFTEKTSKPIISRRLFVMFAGWGYLANLKRLGFRTFGDVIDESYDTETDDLLRWQQAWDQVKWLSEQPQEEILERIRPTVEHNAEVMLTTDWYDLFLSQFEQDFARIAAG